MESSSAHSLRSAINASHQAFLRFGLFAITGREEPRTAPAEWEKPTPDFSAGWLPVNPAATRASSASRTGRVLLVDEEAQPVRFLTGEDF